MQTYLRLDLNNFISQLFKWSIEITIFGIFWLVLLTTQTLLALQFRYISRALVYMTWFNFPWVDFEKPQKRSCFGIFPGIRKTYFIPMLSPYTKIAVPGWITFASDVQQELLSLPKGNDNHLDTISNSKSSTISKRTIKEIYTTLYYFCIYSIEWILQQLSIKKNIHNEKKQMEQLLQDIPKPQDLFSHDTKPIIIYLHGNSSNRAGLHRIRLYKFLSCTLYPFSDSLNKIIDTILHWWRCDLVNDTNSKRIIHHNTTLYTIIQTFFKRISIICSSHSSSTAIATTTTTTSSSNDDTECDSEYAIYGLGANSHVISFDYRQFGDNLSYKYPSLYKLARIYNNAINIPVDIDKINIDFTPSPDVLCEDSLAVWDWLLYYCNVKPSRIFLFAHSLGTGILVHLLHRITNRIVEKYTNDNYKNTRKSLKLYKEMLPRGIIMEAPLRCVPDVALDCIPLRWFINLCSFINIPLRYWLRSQLRFDLYDTLQHWKCILRNCNYVNNIQFPILIMHGLNDDIISYKHSIDIYNTIINERFIKNSNTNNILGPPVPVTDLEIMNRITDTVLSDIDTIDSNNNTFVDQKYYTYKYSIFKQHKDLVITITTSVPMHPVASCLLYDVSLALQTTSTGAATTVTSTPTPTPTITSTPTSTSRTTSISTPITTTPTTPPSTTNTHTNTYNGIQSTISSLLRQVLISLSHLWGDFISVFWQPQHSITVEDRHTDLRNCKGTKTLLDCPIERNTGFYENDSVSLFFIHNGRHGNLPTFSPVKLIITSFIRVHTSQN